MQWESTTYTYGRVRQPPELCHYGIKGQKWGLRRYQYENGSYTPEGKERYRKSSESGGSSAKPLNKSGKRTRHEKAIRDLDEVLDSKNPKVQKAYTEKDRKDLLDYRNKLAAKDNLPLRSKGAPKGKEKNDRDSWKAKDVKDLSDEELRKRNNRLQAEQNYKNNVTPQWKKDAKQWGKEALKAILITSVVTVLAESFKETLKPHIKNKMNDIYNKASKKRVSALNSAKREVAPYLAALTMKKESAKNRLKKG